MNLDEVRMYEELIDVVKQDYRMNPRKNADIHLGWCDTDDKLCQEINLWTYWQGWKYAERQSEISFLVLGQDWGCPNGNMDGGAIENIKLMNAGIDVMYLHKRNLNSREAQTDKNLISLFAEIGYKDIDAIRYPDLFFANFNLGYRTSGSISGGMTDDLMDADAKYIRKLIDILKPQNILCLGENVSKATFKMLFGKNEKYSSYNDFVTNSKGFEHRNNQYSCKVFPLFHTGYYGVNLNRKGGMYQHIEDWKEMFKNRQNL